jgi:hypothetical protein
MRFDILRNPEYGTYRWKLQDPPGSGYICSSVIAFSTFDDAAKDARRFRKIVGIKAVVPRRAGPS